MPISRELLSDIKIRLDITWEDEATDIKINSLAEDGMFYIDEKLGDAGDYTTPGYPRMLLMEYVRYARDNAVDVFENNYITTRVNVYIYYFLKFIGADNPLYKTFFT